MERLRDRLRMREVEDAYGVALTALAASIVLLIASDARVGSISALFAVGLQVFALSVTARVSGARHRSLIIAFGIMVVVVFAAVMGVYNGGDTGDAVSLVGWLLLVLGTIGAIGKRLAQYKTVSLPMVLGLLCIYLLLGLSFGLIYAFLGLVFNPAFSVPDPGISSAIYFSFITLTTVGYGDIVPIKPISEAFTVLEAILGQLYLVSVVSLAVSRLGTRRGGREADVPEADADATEPAQP
jgi:hypothetical protein